MRKMLFLILGFIIINIFSYLLTSAYSPDMEYKRIKTNGDYYLNIENIKYDGSIVTFWERLVFKGMELRKDRVSINCEKNTFAIKNRVIYSLDGSVSSIYSFENQLLWKGIVIGTEVDYKRNLLC